MLKVFRVVLFITLVQLNLLSAGNVTVDLIGVNPLSINISGTSVDEEAGSFSIFLYYNDDGVTELNAGDVDATQLTTTFGWTTTFETKQIETSSWSRGGHTFTKRLNYGNAGLISPDDDYWPTSGVDALVCTFTTVGSGHAFIEVQGVDGIADFGGIGHTITFGNQDIPLPVELSSFLAKIESGVVTLNWATESEINNLGFEVYRSLEEEGEYDLLSSYKDNTQLQGQGSSSSSQDYAFSDETAEPGTTCWYKLADISYNGERTFHNAVSIDVPIKLPEKFKFYANYPNPFNPSTKIKFDLPDNKGKLYKTSLVVFNSLGQVVENIYNGNITAGSYELSWDGRLANGSLAPSGMYIALLKAGKYTQTQKMLLLK